MLLAEPKAKADNTYDCTKTLIIYSITKSEFYMYNSLLYIVLKKITPNTLYCKEPSYDIVIGNHASAHSLQITVNLADNYSNL